MQCKKVTTKTGLQRWECVADGPADPITGKRQQIKRRDERKNVAQKKVEQAIRKLEESGLSYRIGETMSFEEVALRWIEDYERTGVKKSTLYNRKKSVKVLCNYMGKWPIGKISASGYQDVINKMSEDYVRTTVQGHNTTAGLVFQYAMRDKIIKENPKEHVVVPRKRKTVEDIEKDKVSEKYLTTKELQEFLTVTQKRGLDLDREMFYLLAFSGMRSGEMLALKWSDISFETNELRITKTLYNEKNNMNEYELTPPKTTGSIRTINMDKHIMDLLEPLKKKQRILHMSKRHLIEDYHDADFVFSRPNGFPFIQKTVGRRMKRLLEFTGIEKKATPHIFRHTHISMLAEAGVDLPTIMKRVGHEDIDTTMKIYTHVTDKMKKDASEKVHQTYRDILENIL